jgi:hypothetical protein
MPASSKPVHDLDYSVRVIVAWLLRLTGVSVSGLVIRLTVFSLLFLNKNEFLSRLQFAHVCFTLLPTNTPNVRFISDVEIISVWLE